ncbi:MAG TPA: hypothetical protein VJ697_16810, partial [Nitrososphaeraceae archaeon]|nr:hypothetical protein [Nitrososphaeraceae archaeon]
MVEFLIIAVISEMEITLSVHVEAFGLFYFETITLSVINSVYCIPSKIFLCSIWIKVSMIAFEPSPELV